jgi:hypothetical protein
VAVLSINEILNFNHTGVEKEIVQSEGEKVEKRKRGRPKKVDKALICYSLEENSEIETISSQTESDLDLAYHALLAKIQGDPQTFREAINSPDKENWQEAINAELNSLVEKEVFVVVDRDELLNDNESANILDSR